MLIAFSTSFVKGEQAKMEGRNSPHDSWMDTMGNELKPQKAETV